MRILYIDIDTLEEKGVLDDIKAIIKAKRQSNKTYMMMETVK